MPRWFRLANRQRIALALRTFLAGFAVAAVCTTAPALLHFRLPTGDELQFAVTFSLGAAILLTVLEQAPLWRKRIPIKRKRD